MNKDEFKILFDKYYKEIKHFLYYKSGDMKLAEDLTQDVFFTLWEKRDIVQMNTARPFLFKIALNLFISHYRRNRVEFCFRNDFLTNLFSESPQLLLEFDELKIRFQNVIESLPDKQRTVFLMNRMDGLTFVKIGESLSISVKTVEKRMKEALIKIEKAINLKV